MERVYAQRLEDVNKESVQVKARMHNEHVLVIEKYENVVRDLRKQIAVLKNDWYDDGKSERNAAVSTHKNTQVFDIDHDAVPPPPNSDGFKSVASDNLTSKIGTVIHRLTGFNLSLIPI